MVVYLSLGSSIDNRNLDLFFSCSAVGIPFDNGRTKEKKRRELRYGEPSKNLLFILLCNLSTSKNPKDYKEYKE
jgi:hypothetical protein